MRKIQLWNQQWLFTKENQQESIQLPHTWNAKDGQDGGNDYYRGTCTYTKTFEKPELQDKEEVWVEFRGVANSATVCLNDTELCKHDGGYSTFRVNLTDHLQDTNTLTVLVSNEKNDSVYPQKADFTFYGGIYRDVYLLVVPQEHFELAYYGTPGIKVTPVVDLEKGNATVTVETYHNAKEVTITVNGESKTVEHTATFEIPNVHLWNGLEDPYLYEATATLSSGDCVSTKFGCRTIGFDSEKGFLLNGKQYRLCGAARHQDRQGLGNALTQKEHEEDVALLLEMGANTVRLAHYQQDQYMYDLCDQSGLVAWAEIPYITEHLANGNENSISQMKELLVQCYNHPSIVCWGLSNEITTTGGVTEAIIENHKVLNDLCHEIDPTRPTTMAHVFMLSPDDPFVTLPDIRSFNLYYGWYVGEMTQNDEWFDSFHQKHPDTVIGLSEYGADANPQYQNGKPEKGDWSETYQALYHEHMLKMWHDRPYIWAMHCWNMFDFGADGRDEGGKPGQNQKGLVTFDRKLKKDAFYIYKAYLSKEPFVHLCGSRYIERTETETEIKVYSNLPEVSLYMDGELLETKSADKVFVFHANITGEHTFKAVSGNCEDTMTITHVEKQNESYVKPGTQVTNWFDREDEIVKEGYFSIKDSMESVRANPEANAVLDELLAPLQKMIQERYGDVAKNVTLPPEVQAMMAKMSVENTLKQMGALITPEFVHKLNSALNGVKK